MLDPQARAELGLKAKPRETEITKKGLHRRLPVGEYEPEYRSGNWAILQGLLDLEGDGHGQTAFSKEALIRASAPHADAAFVPTSMDLQNNDFYTAFSGQKDLEAKGLIVKPSRTTWYFLRANEQELDRGGPEEGSGAPAPGPGH